MSMFRSRLPATRHGAIAAAFLAVALVFGGGGSPSAAAEILVQLAFACAALAWLWWAPRKHALRTAPAQAQVWLAALLIALPLLQLIPLPPVVWHNLPGRELEREALALIGEEEGWRALSIVPAETLASVLALIPPLGLMLAVTTLGNRDRRFLILVVAAVGLLGAALGAVQLASGGRAFYLYELSHYGWLTGFFANRNAAADGLLIGSLALTAWLAARPAEPPLTQAKVIVFLALQLLLLAAVVLTGSRMGIALAVVVMVATGVMLRPIAAARGVRRTGWWLVGALAALVVLAPLLAGNVQLAGVAQRFDATGDFRSELWRDSWQALAAFFPAGSGVGTFVHAFLPFERLAVLDPSYPNRAHNDYLEFLIEGGLPALLVLAAGGGLLWRAIASTYADAQQSRAVTWFAIATLSVIALHSIVDYPLRNMAIASLAGLAAGMLSTTVRRPDGRVGEHAE